MAKYRVNFATTKWCTVDVEAEDEASAIDEAYQELPSLSAQESGWGSFGRWSADQDEWLPVDEFFQVWKGEYNEEEDGPVVELEDDGA